MSDSEQTDAVRSPPVAMVFIIQAQNSHWQLTNTGGGGELFPIIDGINQFQSKLRAIFSLHLYLLLNDAKLDQKHVSVYHSYVASNSGL